MKTAEPAPTPVQRPNPVSSPPVEGAGVESVASQGVTLALILRANLRPAQTTFLTPQTWKQQVGFVVYPQGGEIRRHVHRPVERRLTGTSEVLVVRSGRCDVDLYDDARQFVATRTLNPGDVLVMAAGGHAFRMLEDTTFLEIKQGPYTGVDEKECF